MPASRLPSVPRAFGGPLPSAGNPSILLLCARQRRCAWFRRGAETRATRFLGRVEGYSKKNRLPGSRTQNAARIAHAPPPAGDWHSLSLTAGAPPKVRARSRHFALGFIRLEPGPLRGCTRTLVSPRLGPCGASTSPESGVAVSTHAHFLSREKRKMWLTFSRLVYL